MVNNEELFKKYQKLIQRTANKHVKTIQNIPTFSYEDIYQLASIGFVEACENFDVNKGTKFSTYACNMMNWCIHKALRNRRSIIHFPNYFNEIWRIANKFQLTNKDIDKLLKYKPKTITEEQVIEAMKWYNNIAPLSLDSPIDEDTESESRELYETINGGVIDETVAIVEDFLNSLTEKQRVTVDLLMKDKSQTEIGEILGVTQPQVSRIVKSVQRAWLKYKGVIK